MATDDYLKVYKTRFTNWSGGQRDEVKPTLLDDNQSQILKDVTLDQRGTLYPCPGHRARYATPGDTKVDGIGYYEKPATGKQYLLVAIGTHLYYDDLSVSPPALVEITGTFTASDAWDFTVFNDKVYIANGKDILKTWDGLSLVELVTSQIDTATVVGIITTSGNATVVVTAAGVTGSPKTVSVPVSLGDNAAQVAAKITTALKADSVINAFLFISNTDATVAISPQSATANDSTLNLSVDNGTCAGLTATPTSDNTVEWSTFPYIFSHLEVHTNMLWGVEAGTSRLRWSNILDGTRWAVNDFMDFNSMDGDSIRRMIRYTSYLFVGKRKSKAYLTGDTTSNYAYTWLEGGGTMGQNTVDVAEGYVAYIATDGIHMTNITTDTLISFNLNEAWRTRVNKSALDKAALIWWRNYVVVSLPVDGSTVNNEVWCYDMRYHAWVILTHLNIACFTKAYVNGDEVLFGADNTEGQILRLFDYSYLYYPDGYYLVEYEWLSKEWTFGEPERYKLFKNIYLELEGVEELSRVNMWMYVDDIEYEVDSAAVDVPDGAGLYRHVRLIPPIYGAVLGRKLSLKLQGRVGVRSVVVEYSMRSNIPPGGVI